MTFFDMQIDVVIKFPRIPPYGHIYSVEFMDYAQVLVVEDAVSNSREEPRENFILQQIEEIL